MNQLWKDWWEFVITINKFKSFNIHVYKKIHAKSTLELYVWYPPPPFSLHLKLSIVEVYMNWTFYCWNLYEFISSNLACALIFAKNKQWHLWTLIYTQFTLFPKPRIHKNTNFNISSCWLPRHFLHHIGLQQNQTTNLICVLPIFYASTIYVESKHTTFFHWS